MEKEFEWLAERLPKAPLRILDIGAGKSMSEHDTNDLVKFMLNNNYQVIGIDLKKVSFTHPNFMFIQGDFLKNKLDDQSFDVITSTQTWQHIGMNYNIAVNPEYRQTLNPVGDRIFVEEIYRILKDTGKALIGTVIEPSTPRRDSRKFTKESIKKLLENRFCIRDELIYERGNYTVYCMEWRKIT